MYIYIYIYFDACTALSNGADVTYLGSNWLIGWLRNKTMARVCRLVSFYLFCFFRPLQ